MTNHEIIKDKLCSINVPFLEIKVYGRQITVECKSLLSCQKFASVISKFAKIKGIINSISYNKENKNTVMNPSAYKVYRLYAVIGD